MAMVLRPGVSFCRPGDRTIFLDVRRDRYFCLSVEAEKAFVELQASPDREVADYPALDQARRDGLFVGGADAAVIAPCPSPPPAIVSCYSTGSRAPLFQIAVMAARLVTAIVSLKTRPLHQNLAAISRRKSSLVTVAGGGGALSVTAAALRGCATLFTSLDRCLPRSIAIAHRLIDRRIEPMLILGVKLGPFEAHAWVQHGSVVVSDSVDHVRLFTPILIL